MLTKLADRVPKSHSEPKSKAFLLVTCTRFIQTRVWMAREFRPSPEHSGAKAACGQWEDEVALFPDSLGCCLGI